MIETLSSATLAETGAMAGYDLVMTRIVFQDGDLCRPLYQTLFDYTRAPKEARFEPGVQILRAGEPLRFLFQLRDGIGVEFEEAAGQPVVVSITDPSSGGLIPGLTAVLLDPVTCELTWDQEAADRAARGGKVKVTALRLLCRLLGRKPTVPEQVDGGLYLAIVNRPEDVGPDLGIGEAGAPEPGTIKMLGSDSLGRPLYDLFLPGVQKLLPDRLGLEPTIRVRESEKVNLSVQIATPPGVGLQFERAVVDPREVRVHGFEPPGKPPQLRAAERQDLGRRCQLVWVEETRQRQPGQNQACCTTGRIATFYLSATLKEGPEWTMEKKRRALWRRRLQLDPTVIQPPSCTASGICI